MLSPTSLPFPSSLTFNLPLNPCSELTERGSFHPWNKFVRSAWLTRFQGEALPSSLLHSPLGNSSCPRPPSTPCAAAVHPNTCSPISLTTDTAWLGTQHVGQAGLELACPCLTSAVPHQCTPHTWPICPSLILPSHPVTRPPAPYTNLSIHSPVRGPSPIRTVARNTLPTNHHTPPSLPLFRSVQMPPLQREAAAWVQLHGRVFPRPQGLGPSRHTSTAGPKLASQSAL